MAGHPVRNKWIVQCGFIMCACVPILAGICIAIRELPGWWFWIDSAFAPGAAVPLWIAYRDIRAIERHKNDVPSTYKHRQSDVASDDGYTKQSMRSAPNCPGIDDSDHGTGQHGRHAEEYTA
jgi:hypothetical protein